MKEEKKYLYVFKGNKIDFHLCKSKKFNSLFSILFADDNL